MLEIDYGRHETQNFIHGEIQRYTSSMKTEITLE